MTRSAPCAGTTTSPNPNPNPNPSPNPCVGTTTTNPNPSPSPSPNPDPNLGVVDPVAGAPRADDALELVGLDPQQLLHELVAPQVQALAPELHRAPRHPEEDDAVVLQALHVHAAHLLVGHRAVPGQV